MKRLSSTGQSAPLRPCSELSTNQENKGVCVSHMSWRPSCCTAAWQQAFAGTSAVVIG